MSYSYTGKKVTSWGLIIFWFIFFWPVGLYLLFKRLNNDKSATIKDKKALTIVSYILMGMGLIYAYSAFTGKAEGSEGTTSAVSAGIASLVLFGGGGVILNRVAKKIRMTGVRYKKYIALIINHSQSSIDNIASAVGVSYEAAVKDLQKMIDSGYFFGAYIDLARREFVIARSTAPQAVGAESAAAIHEQIKIAACGSCGANNRVTIGRISECAYCGSPLQ